MVGTSVYFNKSLTRHQITSEIKIILTTKENNCSFEVKTFNKALVC